MNESGGSHISRVVARNSAYGLVAQVLIKVLSFGFSMLIVRQLGPESFGQYAAVLAFGAVFVSLSDLGLSPYAVRDVARGRDGANPQARTSSLYGNVLTLRVSLALVASGLMIATALLTARPPAMTGAIALGCLGLVMYALQGTCEAILAGFERLDLTARARVLNQLVFVLVGAAALLLGAGYYGLVIGNLLGIAAMTFICWRAVRWLGLRTRRPDPRLWPALLKASVPFGVISITLGLSYKFDSVLLNVFRGDAETGYYNAAYNLVFSAVIVSNVVNTSLYPSLVRQASTATQHLPAMYQRTLRYLLLLSLPMAFAGWAAADEFVPFLFSSSYGPAVSALKILIWVVPLMFVSEFLGYVVVVQGRERRVARAVVVSTLLNVVLNLALVPRFGLLSAAVLTVVTEAILVGQYVWSLRQLLRTFSWGTVLMRPLLAAFAMLTVILLVSESGMAIRFMAAGLTYVGMLLTLRVIGADELRFVLSLRQRKPTIPQSAAAA